MYYLFPFNLVEPNARILIYGAGKAGKNYLNQIRSTGYCTVVCMIDKNYRKIHVDDMDVVGPEEIKNYEYDGIVLSQIDDEVKAANEKVWAHEYNDRPISEVTLEWFQENGFTTEDQIRICRAYTDTYAGKCGIFLFYAPVEDLWSYMEKQIGNHFTIVGRLDYDFQSNYVAFENLMRQVYNDWDQYSEWLSRKMDILVMAPLKYRIILVSDEERKTEKFYEEIRALKLELRQHLFMDIDHKIPIIVHASDSKDEYRHLRNLFLSANNITWLNKNMRQYYRGWFLEQIGAVKNWCNQNNILWENVCIVGSAVVELFGIRDAHNFNMIVNHVKPQQMKLLPNIIEWIDFDYCMDENNHSIANQVIIEDDNYHTVFADMLDVAKLRKWYDFAEHYDNKNELQKQIKRELYKRGES